MRTAVAIVVAFLWWGSPGLAEPPCMFNPATRAYQLCHNVTAGGQCAHYGAACGRATQPRYNPQTGASQECLHQTADGKCAHYGARSGAPGQCMFNPATRAHQKCLAFTAGGASTLSRPDPLTLLEVNPPGAQL